MPTIRLTMAQALIRFLKNQYIELDGSKTPFFAGVLGIFGHGNVAGIGPALQENPISGITWCAMNRQPCTSPVALPRH